MRSAYNLTEREIRWAISNSNSNQEEYIEEYTKQQSKKHVQSIEQEFRNRQALIKMDEEFLRYEAYLDECERLGILPGEKK